MKQVCLVCERTSVDRNLYCQEIHCPAEKSPTILDNGEWLGDMEIVKPVVVLRSAVLYEAMRQKQRLFLKVAHPGVEHTDRLQREALFLRTNPHPQLPALLPPYTYTTLNQDVYGRIMFQGHLLYFYLFTFVEGEPLRDLLLKNPQLWINHVGWLAIELAGVVNFLHIKQVYHYGLCPEILLVRFDAKSSKPRLLLVDLGAVSQGEKLTIHWQPSFVAPAYTAPELVATQPVRPDHRTDVYGVGLILYELLVGQPPVRFKLLRSEEVYQAVVTNQRAALDRLADVHRVARIAQQAVSLEPAGRHPNVAELGEQLSDPTLFLPPPTERTSWLPSLRMILIAVVVLLALAFLITFADSFARLWALF
jgi:serine/threonine protein kinase